MIKIRLDPTLLTLIQILDTSTGKELDLRQEGELCFKGPTIMKGYLGRPEATRGAVDQNGWLHSGECI